MNMKHRKLQLINSKLISMLQKKTTTKRLWQRVSTKLTITKFAQSHVVEKALRVATFKEDIGKAILSHALKLVILVCNDSAKASVYELTRDPNIPVEIIVEAPKPAKTEKKLCSLYVTRHQSTTHSSTSSMRQSMSLCRTVSLSQMLFSSELTRPKFCVQPSRTIWHRFRKGPLHSSRKRQFVFH